MANIATVSHPAEGGKSPAPFRPLEIEVTNK